ASPNRRGKATRTSILRWEEQSHSASSSEPAKNPATTSPEPFERCSSRKKRSQKATRESTAVTLRRCFCYQTARPLRPPVRAQKAMRLRVAFIVSDPHLDTTP